MNAISQPSVVALATMTHRADAPASAALTVALAALERIVVGGETAHLTLEVDAEAQRRLAAIASLLGPATHAMCVGWLKAFAASADRLRTPPTAKRFARACDGTWETCEALPAGCWTRDTRIAFQAVQRYWPTPAEVHGFLAPYAASWRSQAAGLRMLVSAGEQHRQRLARLAEREVEPRLGENGLQCVVETRKASAAPQADTLRQPVKTASLPLRVRASYLPDHQLLAGVIESLKQATEPARIKLLEHRRDCLLRKLGVVEG